MRADAFQFSRDLMAPMRPAATPRSATVWPCTVRRGTEVLDNEFGHCTKAAMVFWVARNDTWRSSNRGAELLAVLCLVWPGNAKDNARRIETIGIDHRCYQLIKTICNARDVYCQVDLFQRYRRSFAYTNSRMHPYSLSMKYFPRILMNCCLQQSLTLPNARGERLAHPQQCAQRPKSMSGGPSVPLRCSASLRFTIQELTPYLMPSVQRLMRENVMC